MDPRRLEAAARALEQEVPALGHGLRRTREQLVVVRRRLDRRRLAADERLPERLRERAAEAERLADRLHLGAEAALGERELLEVEAGRLHRDVVERGLERRRRLAGDVVR